MIRVILPYHLRTLANVGEEISLEIDEAGDIGSVLNALEARYPVLLGTIRDHVTKRRRPMLRFFACEEDISHEPFEYKLPADILSGKEPFWILGAIAGG
ncbi:MoaD/ThiS family protein [Telmatocola sphagniphila]|uniref:MoaD/ThiS family protein n=1 Tax=Telmatocola sphagniphila TaxID=1123043 RepID=A0A8E6EWR3_9BACT|nr:MoaD/ThiS family protein [Telmatocola sphagniphila]QVL30431.1 MoaD/ThiS family protein [Telmatocola sphagniphila]